VTAGEGSVRRAPAAACYGPAVSVLVPPTRGFRMMCVAVALFMFHHIGELVLSLQMFMASSGEDVLSVVRWSARGQFLVMAAVALLMVGVASNLAELRRRRWPLTAAGVALAGFGVAFLVHAWLYGLLGDVADGNFFVLIDDANELPTRMFLATAGRVIGLFATVRLVRAYAMTESNHGLREEARNIGGMLLLLLIVDTFYRFSYGLGVGLAFGPMALIAAVLLFAFWLWCYRQVGALYVSAIYYLRVAQDVAVVEVVTPAAASLRPTASSPSTSRPGITRPPLGSKPAIAPPPVVTPIEPTESAAPTQDAPTPIDGGPRFLG
jgi:hypothetical protein